MVTRRKKTKAKAPKRPKAKPKAKRGVKAKAQRPAKALLKTAKRAPRPVKKKIPVRHARGGHPRRVKLVRRKLSAADEMAVNALIAKVYQRAAEEMRRLEDVAATAKIDLMQHAAQELLHLEGLAKKFNA